MAETKPKDPTTHETTTETGKKSYIRPSLSQLGSVTALTLGQGGSSIDGNHTYTQTGGGNDGTGPHDG